MTQAPPLRKFAGFVPPEKNYFHMPNEWIDICAEIDNLAEIKVIQYVLRHTWGYQEYGIAKAITVDEFMYGRKRTDGTRMDKGTGLKSDRSVKDGIKDAIEHGYLICEIDATDKARIKKSYAVKMLPEQLREGYNLPPDARQVVSTPQTGSIYPSEVQNLPLRDIVSTPRSEKDTIERHYKKDTIERQERDVADATARSQTSSQNDLSEDTEKREAVKVSTPVQEVTQGLHKQHTNLVQHPPADVKPPANKVPTPKRPRPQQQELTDELPAGAHSKPVEPLAEMTWGTRKCLQWFDYWRGGVLIAKYKLQQAAGCAKGLAEQFDEATFIEIRNEMAGDQYYIDRGGVDVCDVANNCHKYLNKIRTRQKPPSNEHKATQQPANAFIERCLDKDYNKKKLEWMREENARRRQAQAEGVQ